MRTIWYPHVPGDRVGGQAGVVNGVQKRQAFELTASRGREVKPFKSHRVAARPDDQVGPVRPRTRFRGLRC